MIYREKPPLCQLPLKSKRRNHKCDTCGKSFESSSAFIWHLIYPKRKRPFLCDICKKTFKRKYHLNRHVKKVHRQKQTASSSKKCIEHGQEVQSDFFQTPSTSSAARGLIQSEQLASEESVFTPGEAEEFFKGFNINLDIMKLETSSQLELFSVIETDKDKLECQHCGQQFSDEIFLKEHEKQFHQSN
ncbi:zinc finger protein 257-like [Centruroides sculpturatus]|uniref:zinc finger protein 257-like n=1 Tax=Centruroides sculpturatus TaxID=218467 RepID=UPI000C6DE0D8|nr:zinc finger protein 257-like [Centruroides sculpturatus]